MHLQQFGNDYAGHFLAAVPEPAAVASVGSALAMTSLARLPRRRRRTAP
jgi:hypothetical protein